MKVDSWVHLVGLGIRSAEPYEAVRTNCGSSACKGRPVAAIIWCHLFVIKVSVVRLRPGNLDIVFGCATSLHLIHKRS